MEKIKQLEKEKELYKDLSFFTLESYDDMINQKDEIIYDILNKQIDLYYTILNIILKSEQYNNKEFINTIKETIESEEKLMEYFKPKANIKYNNISDTFNKLKEIIYKYNS